MSKNLTTFFVSDLHGKVDRYNKLFNLLKNSPPKYLFMGGDLFPSVLKSLKDQIEFINKFFIYNLKLLKNELNNYYPKIFLILGNDDGKANEVLLNEYTEQGLITYIHNKIIDIDNFKLIGYSYIPPTPFILKDWEKYDVSRYVDPGCISPLEGKFTVNINEDEITYSTIKDDLDKFVHLDMEHSIFLFHSPPYKTRLDRAALDGKTIDYAPVDVHVGSIAIRNFIETYQPYLTLHGHIHESTRLTGQWNEHIGKTICFNGACDTNELCVIKFDLNYPNEAVRLLM